MRVMDASRIAGNEISGLLVVPVGSVSGKRAASARSSSSTIDDTEIVLVGLGDGSVLADFGAMDTGSAIRFEALRSRG